MSKNKFSILAVIFTIGYLGMRQVIMSDMYSSLGEFHFFWFQLIYILFLGFMAASILAGTAGIMRAKKATGDLKWGLLLFTVLNSAVFLLSIVVAIFPHSFY